VNDVNATNAAEPVTTTVVVDAPVAVQPAQVVENSGPVLERAPVVVVPSKVAKAKEWLKIGFAYLERFAFEIFIVAVLFAFAAFVILFPRVTLMSAGAVASLFGWVFAFRLWRELQTIRNLK
jgi:hypothetical protein